MFYLVPPTSFKFKAIKVKLQLKVVKFHSINYNNFFENSEYFDYNFDHIDREFEISQEEIGISFLQWKIGSCSSFNYFDFEIKFDFIVGFDYFDHFEYPLFKIGTA